MGDKREHLAQIQSVVLRMTLGSFLLAGWSALVVGGLLAVAEDPAHARFVWLACALTVGFWALDAHCWRQRRLFRLLESRVRSLPEPITDFSMDTSGIGGEADRWGSVFLSARLWLWYGLLLAVIAVVRQRW